MPSHPFRSMYQPVQDIAYEDEPEKTEDLNDIAFQYRHLQDGLRSFSQKAVNSRYVMLGNTVLFAASLAMLLTSISVVSRMNVSTQRAQETCSPEDVSAKLSSARINIT
jgi:hypothetical protein